MICDAHIHVGEFFGGLYFTPEEIAAWARQNNIGKFLFFQTARSGRYPSAYARFLEDCAALKSLAPKAAIPALWLKISAFKHIEKYRPRDFAALKLHPQVEKNLTDTKIEFAIKTAADLNMPLIVHTSFDEYCSCLRIGKICEHAKHSAVILAHGRPFAECIKILQNSENIYADTAYMPPEEAEKFAESGVAGKLIFGSDFPIDRHFFPNEDANLRYKNFMERMRKILPPAAMFENFNKLFKPH